MSDWSSDVCSSDLFGVNGDPRLSLAPIRHEPTSETGVHHVSGTLSIARLEPGSARGEFTIMVGDQRPGFDADPTAPGDNLGYAAFGQDRKSTRLNSSH